MQRHDSKWKKRGTRRCAICQSSKGMIRKYGLGICRKCFRETAEELGFKKYM